MFEDLPENLRCICEGRRTDLTPHQQEQFANWCKRYLESRSNGSPMLKKRGSIEAKTLPTGGPGTELKLLLASLSIQPKSSCDCTSKAAEMDRLGVEAVRAQRDVWMKHLTDAYHSSGWLEGATAAMLALTLGLPLSVQGLLDEAIRRAEAKQ